MSQGASIPPRSKEAITLSRKSESWLLILSVDCWSTPLGSTEAIASMLIIDLPPPNQQRQSPLHQSLITSTSISNHLYINHWSTPINHQSLLHKSLMHPQGSTEAIGSASIINCLCINHQSPLHQSLIACASTVVRPPLQIFDFLIFNLRITWPLHTISKMKSNSAWADVNTDYVLHFHLGQLNLSMKIGIVIMFCTYQLHSYPEFV